MSNPLSQKEIISGSCYALFQFFILPEISLIIKQLTGLPAWSMQFGMFLLNFICTILIFRHFLAANWETFSEKTFPILGIVLLGLLGYYLSNFLINELIMLVRPDYYNLNDASISLLAAQNRFLMIVGTVLLVPTAEEALFRGLLFRGIYDRKPIAAWILCVSLFSLVHIIGYLGHYDGIRLLLAFIQYLPAGLVLCFVYKKTDTIFAPILLHTLINFVGMCLIG